jgi:hypothetical protein
MEHEPGTWNLKRGTVWLGFGWRAEVSQAWLEVRTWDIPILEEYDVRQERQPLRGEYRRSRDQDSRGSVGSKRTVRPGTGIIRSVYGADSIAVRGLFGLVGRGAVIRWRVEANHSHPTEGHDDQHGRNQELAHHQLTGLLRRTIPAPLWIVKRLPSPLILKAIPEAS